MVRLSRLFTVRACLLTGVAERAAEGERWSGLTAGCSPLLVRCFSPEVIDHVQDGSLDGVLDCLLYCVGGVLSVVL